MQTSAIELLDSRRGVRAAPPPSYHIRRTFSVLCAAAAAAREPIDPGDPVLLRRLELSVELREVSILATSAAAQGQLAAPPTSEPPPPAPPPNPATERGESERERRRIHLKSAAKLVM